MKAKAGSATAPRRPKSPAIRALYATDGRAPAIAAGALLASVADPGRVEVTVLHVEEYRNPLVAEQMAEAAFASARAPLADAGFAVQTKRVGGDVKPAIARELDETTYGLVAVGAGNTGWLGRLILGGVSTFVMHRSTVPSLIVHRSPIEGGDRVRVVVGADGSPGSKRAVDTLIGVARPDRCDVFVRSVVEPPQPNAPGAPDVVPFPPDEFDRVVAELRVEAEAHLASTVERLEAAGFSSAYDVAVGSAEVRLLDAVRDRDADLVVVGSRGLGRIAGVALGSVSAHIVRTAPATLVAHDAGGA